MQRLQTSEAYVYRRQIQILTSKDGPRAVRVNPRVPSMHHYAGLKNDLIS